MNIVVICGGSTEEARIDLQPYVEYEAKFIGVDHGTLTLLKQGIIPVAAIGDFDSVTEAEYEEIARQIEFVDRYRMEKDETDLELAVQHAMRYRPDLVLFTGVTCGRLDHMFSAMRLLYRLQVEYKSTRFHIQNKWNDVAVVLDGASRIPAQEKWPYISFFAATPRVTGVTLEGFRYNVEGDELAFGTTRFTSNEIEEPYGDVYVEDGALYVVRSADQTIALKGNDA